LSSPEAPPPTRWAVAGTATSGYGRCFDRLVTEGTDVDGEARLADALLPRGARVLDLGSGMGRVAAALAARGHEVVATEPDPALRAQSSATYPGLAVLPHEALALDPDRVGRFDLVVAVGNVMVYLGEGTERAVLARVRSLLAPGGRLLVGFHPHSGPAGARDYPPDELAEDARASGLRVDHRFGSYELHPPADDYCVLVLSAAD
jgi:SAM-dependent methyltransferase